MTAEGVVLRDVGRVLKQLCERGVVRRNCGRRGMSRGDPAGTPDYVGRLRCGHPCAIECKAEGWTGPREKRERDRVAAQIRFIDDCARDGGVGMFAYAGAYVAEEIAMHYRHCRRKREEWHGPGVKSGVELVRLAGHVKEKEEEQDG